MYALNLRGVDVFGLPVFFSATKVPPGADVAFVMVPIEAVSGAFADLAAASIKTAVLLTSGFAETASAGQLQEDRPVELARGYGFLFMGAEQTGIRAVGPGIGNDIGATCNAAAAGRAYRTLSLVAATGNEAMIDVTVVIDFLIDDPYTRVVAALGETIRSRGALWTWLGARRRPVKPS